jgi:hypothetical protein
MKNRVVAASLISMASLLASQALAQNLSEPVKTHVAVLAPQMAKPVQAAKATPAAGAVWVVLADGIVANAAMAVVAAPAEGFVYER